MNIFLISITYPSVQVPEVGNYVRNLAVSLDADHVSVCTPEKLIAPGHDITEIAMPATAEVSRPKYWNLYKLDVLKKWFFFRKMANYSFYKASFNVFQNLSKKWNYDVLYSHFLFPAGYTAASIAKRTGKPYFIALGESDFTTYLRYYSHQTVRDVVNNAAGIICVSSKIKDILLSGNFIDDSERLFVAPNKANSQIFYPGDKAEARKRLQLPSDSRIAIFVGQFIQRKGPDRVIKAIEKLDKDVKIIYIGKGELGFTSDRILYSGTVQNADLGDYLRASDVFVLPTQAEGSCNAIAEAIACGIPIVTSNVPEVAAQVLPESSVLVEPMVIDDIAAGIQQVLDKQTYFNEKARQGALNNSGDLKRRATEILQFIKSKI